jgi:hypothetical protein
MLDDMRKYVRFGLEALSSQDRGGAGTMRSGAQGVAEQLSSLAAGFLEWSAEARASLLKELKDLVARQIEEMGVARKKDVDALEARLGKLEARVGTKPRTPIRAKTAGRAKTGSRAKVSSSRSARSKASTSASKRTGARRGKASRGSR